MIENFNILINWFTNHNYLFKLILLLGVLLLCIISYFIAKHVIIKFVSKFIKKTSTKIDDIILKRKVQKWIPYIVFFIVLNWFSYLFPSIQGFISKISISFIFLFILLTIGALLNATNDFYRAIDKYPGRPVKGYIQIAKLIIYIFGSIIIVSNLIGKSPVILLSGLGAMTAIVLFIFKDTILSFLASLQITSYDLIRVGDWLEVPNLNANGDVIDVALYTVKVQNFDKTITVIPTYKLIDNTFINWRGMQESGGRRIKRAIYIDQTSIKFCDEKMVNRFKKFDLIAGYIDNKIQELHLHNQKYNFDQNLMINGRRMTNIGTFRAYIKSYLKSLNTIHKNKTFLVRQLAPGSTGIPIEVYVFATTTNWADYENIQSDIFDHILAIVPEFGLRVFQNPTGNDVRDLAKKTSL